MKKLKNVMFKCLFCEEVTCNILPAFCHGSHTLNIHINELFVIQTEWFLVLSLFGRGSDQSSLSIKRQMSPTNPLRLSELLYGETHLVQPKDHCYFIPFSFSPHLSLFLFHLPTSPAVSLLLFFCFSPLHCSFSPPVHTSYPLFSVFTVDGWLPGTNIAAPSKRSC